MRYIVLGNVKHSLNFTSCLPVGHCGPTSGLKLKGCFSYVLLTR